jgi:hypothetical protein
MMAYTVVAGLALGLSAIMTAVTVDHATRIDHQSGPVDVQYRSVVRISHKQVGSVAPGGRPSTLGCRWKADMMVAREAKAASGTMLTRNFVREGVASGNRPGWCSTHHASIASQVARQTRDLDRHMISVAEEDHEVLRAELDRAHGAVSAG